MSLSLVPLAPPYDAVVSVGFSLSPLLPIAGLYLVSLVSRLLSAYLFHSQSLITNTVVITTMLFSLAVLLAVAGTAIEARPNTVSTDVSEVNTIPGIMDQTHTRS